MEESDSTVLAILEDAHAALSPSLNTGILLFLHSVEAVVFSLPFCWVFPIRSLFVMTGCILGHFVVLLLSLCKTEKIVLKT